MNGSLAPKFHQKILLVSLPKDKQRRDRLKTIFPNKYPSFQVIEGEDLTGSMHQQHEESIYHTATSLSAPELGCTLSHIKALKVASRSDAHSVLIIEDDIIGSDQDIEEIFQVTENLPAHHFLLCGGQENLKGNKYLYAHQEKDVFCLPPLLLRFTARACCYAVSPSMASYILKQQDSCLRLADDWKKLLSGQTQLFFYQRLQHPAELNNSYLEAERVRMNRRPLLKRIYSEGIGYTLSTQAIKIIIPALAKLKGWKKISIDPERKISNL